MTLVAMGTEQESSGKVQLLASMVERSELQFPMLQKIEDHIKVMER